VADKRFWEYIDKPVSMIAMADVWAAKRKNRDIRNAELKRKYHPDGRKAKPAQPGNYQGQRNILLPVVVIIGLL
jgi:hypothetical protein